MEPPTSPKPAEITLTPLPEQQQHKEERAQSPVSKRRKVEHKVVITVKVEENSGKHKNDGPPSDFWSWRKYGQKPIKGSPYPRGYYRCSTSKGCSAKKQVERCRTDASVLIITYTSSHNHAGPDLQHISPSSAVTTDHKPLDEIKTEEVPPPPSPNSGNNNHHEDPNTHQSSSCSATATRQELPDNGNTEVASHLNFQSSSCVGASPDLPQANCSATEAEAEDKPLEERCEASPENPTPSDDDHACKCDQMSCCATPTEDKFLAVTCSSDEDARPTSTDVSSGPEPGTKVSETNLNSEDPLCSKPTPTASPICQGEQFNCENAAGEEPRPPSPLKHSPKDIFAIEKPTDADTNHILQSKEIPFDEGSSAEALSCAQTGLSPEEFDFYDELEELPSISPWTSILMGSFFDERILLPS